MEGASAITNCGSRRTTACHSAAFSFRRFAFGSHFPLSAFDRSALTLPSPGGRGEPRSGLIRLFPGGKRDVF